MHVARLTSGMGQGNIHLEGKHVVEGDRGDETVPYLVLDPLSLQDNRIEIHFFVPGRAVILVCGAFSPPYGHLLISEAYYNGTDVTRLMEK
jgi:hypothetical protein